MAQLGDEVSHNEFQKLKVQRAVANYAVNLIGFISCEEDMALDEAFAIVAMEHTKAGGDRTEAEKQLYWKKYGEYARKLFNRKKANINMAFKRLFKSKWCGFLFGSIILVLD